MAEPKGKPEELAGRMTADHPEREQPGQPPADAAAEEVQRRVDEETARGLVGDEVDPTPNEHYTVAGVLAGKPTPEAPGKDGEA